MSTDSDLKKALVEALENKGALSQLRAVLRAEIYKVLEDGPRDRPDLPHVNVLINELILEYLNYNGYRHTASVLESESGHTSWTPVNRPVLEAQLGIAPSTTKLPLLYTMVSNLQSNRQPP
ncbi:centrosomal protein 20-like [Ornithodoros turicata]|uniref:FGFR1 oncogene partner (FOP) N-terminal dimerisation domain-containing protein n=1 Tax=Ornithodoros turicata TaxID=34597 RepID=A0A2R5L705_9ACAR